MEIIPYGIILPKKVENLLVVGRCVAGDKMYHATTRQMVCCIATGQSAGVAAAISVKEDVNCRNVNIKKLQNAQSRCKDYLIPLFKKKLKKNVRLN